MNDVLRVIHDAPGLGTWNMAVDDVLLRTAAEVGQATVRFYTWSEPTLSLGYFQSVSDRGKHSASLGCPVVRRDTGGGAILHDHELTYSIALPQRFMAGWPASRLYEVCHQSLIAALAGVGVSAHLARDHQPCSVDESQEKETSNEPFLCFQRRACFDVLIGDIDIGSAKIAGSAQRRRRGAVLQHGSILLARSKYAPELPGIQELAEIQLTAAGLAATWEPHFLAALEMPATSGGLWPNETELAETICRTRFSSAEHLERR